MLVETTAVSFRSQLLLLYAARGVRGFGDGFAVIILPAYLLAIGFDAVAGGVVAAPEILRDCGNMSAVTVLFVLQRLIQRGLSGRHLMSALGPGFSAGFQVIEG